MPWLYKVQLWFQTLEGKKLIMAGWSQSTLLDAWQPKTQKKAEAYPLNQSDAQGKQGF